MTHDAVTADDQTARIAAAEKVADALDLPVVETLAAADALSEGLAAAQELADALGLAGFRLPSLRGDFSIDSRPHVELGGASAEMVRHLAAWIRERA